MVKSKKKPNGKNNRFYGKKWTTTTKKMKVKRSGSMMSRSPLASLTM